MPKTKNKASKGSRKDKQSKGVLSNMRCTHEDKVIAIFCSDIHLSHKCPIARSAEDDWYEAMARPLRFLRELQKEHNAPVICAGDIFDKWNQPAETINFALKELPKMFYCIPGNHDLPYHMLSERHRCAYDTLVRAGRVVEIDTERPSLLPQGIALHGFPYGKDLKSRNTKNDPLKGFVHIAVIHKYVYTTHISTSYYDGAPPEYEAGRYLKNLKGYDYAVFGDNHQAFSYRPKKGTVIVNCGGLIPRNSDERTKVPRVWLLHYDKSITQQQVPVHDDKWLFDHEIAKVSETQMDLTEFLAEMQNELRRLGLDSYRDRLEQWMHDNRVSYGVRQVLTKALETK